MKSKGLSRRAFLRGAGGVAIALPFLDVMGGSGCASSSPKSDREAAARSSYGLNGFPKRLVVFFSANGTIPERWRPNVGGASEAQLSSIAGPISDILAPLDAYRDQLLVLEGVDMQSSNFGPGDGHQKGMGHMLTGTELSADALFTGGNGELAGWAGGLSVDQRAANVIGTQTKFKSLELGVQVSGATVWSRMAYLDKDQPLPPEEDPSAAFTRIFSQLGADLTRLKSTRHTVLDSVQQDYTALQTRLGNSDRQKLQGHLDAIRDIESRLDTGGAIGGACQLPAYDGSMDLNDSANFPAIGRTQMDLLAMSLACDLTRVASIQFSNSVSNKVHSWLDIPEGHHDLSHEGDSNLDALEKLVRINTWYAEQMAYLLGKLAAIPEGDGTALDNTLVLWCNELGKGNSHTRMNMPYVLAGKAGGALRTGRYINYSGTVLHNNLLVSILNAMGVADTTFGNPTYCTGVLPGLV